MGQGARGKGCGAWSITVLLVVVSWWAVAEAEEPLPGYGTVPAFSLTDQDGQSFSSESLHGQVWVVDFIFTRCAGQCPMMTMQMSRLVRAFEAEPAVHFVSISIDPEHDTPEVLGRYARAGGVAADGRWVFLTGSREAVWRLCQEGFRLALAEDPANADEPITHSVRLVLVDQDGRVRGFYDATDAAAAQHLQRDARRLLKEGVR